MVTKIPVRLIVICLITVLLNSVPGLAQFKASEDTLKDKYLVFFLTNTSVDQADKINTGKDANSNYTFVGEIPQIFGELKTDQEYKYAYGLPGPMLLTQSVAEMQDEINEAFDIAEKYNVPVYFQLDDCNNYTTQFGQAASPKFYENPDWCEWIAFPKEGEEWGGQSNGRLPFYWFNWGSWMHAEAFPSYQSPGFRNFVLGQLNEGVLKPLMVRYNKLKSEGKEYLLAGVAVGWETHIPDNSSSNPFINIDESNLPVNVLQGDTMKIWEAAKYGYNSLSKLGYTEYNLEALYKVIHDYSELLAKTINEAGIPKNKIFTHMISLITTRRELRSTFAPPIWAAVNDYSIPGFTMSPETCPYNIDTLVNEIKKADPLQNNFANAEGYSRGIDDTYDNAREYFRSLYENGASLVTVFGWGRESTESAFAVSHDPTSPFVLAAKIWMYPEADTASVSEWNYTYENGLDGWSLDHNLTGSLVNNSLVLSVKGSDPYMTSPYGLNANTGIYKAISITMKNKSSASSARVYWMNTDDASFVSGKSKTFSINQKDTAYTEYIVDLSATGKWFNRIAQLRFDPVEDGSAGVVEVKQVKLLTAVTGVDEEPGQVPEIFCLGQNFPNPFNPSTTIEYTIPPSGRGLVQLKIYNLLGQCITTLVNEEKTAGTYRAQFNASNLPSGVYYYSLTANGISSAKKMMLLK
jgi:hypothetical protein